MTDYSKLVEALRYCVSGDCENCSYFDKCKENGTAMDQLHNDAAAAIEALQAENADIREELFISQRKYDEFTTIASMQNAMLAKQLPKRGKWITHPEVKNIYGGVYIECPFCGEKYVVQNVSDEKFCRNCGADLRAKMEVQE